MSWGDSWGSTPRHNAIRLAKAFYEGRPLGGNSDTRVEVDERGLVQYFYKCHPIARYTSTPLAVAWSLEHGGEIVKLPLQFRSYWRDKGEARHLKALGVDAQWQWGRRPFLIEGADATLHNHDMATPDKWKARPKWVAPVKPEKIRRERFVNLTGTLFA